MSRTRVKICGITTAGDARAAASLGADYLGVIFAASPRRVDVARAREIRLAVPNARLVGVFRDQPLEEVVQLTRESGIDMVQLHGAEPPAYCDEVLARAGKPVIKAFASPRLPGAAQLALYTTTSYFLFDLDKTEDADGNTTREGIWKEVSRTRRQGFRVFVAGALAPGNVREAIRLSRAFAVDVCRGVERAPGVKDHDVMAKFLAEARA